MYRIMYLQLYVEIYSVLFIYLFFDVQMCSQCSCPHQRSVHNAERTHILYNSILNRKSNALLQFISGYKILNVPSVR